MTAPRIDRANLVRCIACRAWVAPDQRLRAAFRGGHNTRFYVCKACIADYKQPRYCGVCGAALSAGNVDMRWRNGRIVTWQAKCVECRRVPMALYRRRNVSTIKING